MSVWRDRGYVLDSDDEDVELDCDSHLDVNNVDIVQRHACEASSPEQLREDGAEKEQTRHVSGISVAKLEDRGLATREDVVMLEPDVALDAGTQELDTIEKRHDLDGNGSADHQSALPQVTNQDTTYERATESNIIPNQRTNNTTFLAHGTSATDVGNFFPSSVPTDLPELAALDNQTRPHSPDLLRRASVSSSDLSDVDMDILCSSPHAYFNLSSSGVGHISTRTTTSPVPKAAQLPQPNGPGLVLSGPSHRAISVELLPGPAAPARNFRTRKAIQLHPYILEQEKYRQALKARGYRPVHVATSQPTPDQTDGDAQEQDSDSFNVSRTQETTPPDSSDSSTRDFPMPQRPLLSLDESDDENDFPDDLVARHRHVIGGVQEGNKRRKLVETPSNRNSGPALISSTSGVRGKLRSLGLISRSLSLSAIPPSPPRTSSPLNVETTPDIAPQFRRPRGLTPPLIQTPMPSSPPRGTQHTRRRVPELSESDSDQSSVRSLSPDPEAEARQLRRMQKRIRGVLPASWLKLDRKTQHKTSEPALHTPDAAPSPSGPVKGVAQRVISGPSSVHAVERATLVLSDESDVSDGSLGKPTIARAADMRPRSPRQSYLKPHDDTGEVEEYDEIDRMFSAPSRTHSKKGRKDARQSRLTDGFLEPPTHDQTSRSEPRPTERRNRTPASRNTGLKPKKGSNRKRPARISILDVERDNTSNERALPKFIRLAARQARKRSDLGRHSPNQKTIRLATHDDTRDALLPLQSWNAGNLRPSAFVDLSKDDRESSDRVSSSTRNTIRRARSKLGHNSYQPSRSSNTVGNPAHETSARRKGSKTAIYQRHVRPGQLETRKTNLHDERDFLTFAPPPSRLMQIFRNDRGHGAPSRFRLERFLQDREDPSEPHIDHSSDHDTGVKETESDRQKSGLPKRSRKRLTRRMDVELRTFRQPSEPLPDDDIPMTVEERSAGAPAETLQGLGPFGTRYPTDFDVRPLEMGTYFHQSTFIGSGEFVDSLTLQERDLDLPAGRINIELEGQTFNWSAWNEDVSSALAAVLRASSDQLQAVADSASKEERKDRLANASSSLLYFLRSTIKYCSGYLYFIDPVDRLPCVARLAQWLDEFYDMLEEQMNNLKSFAEITAASSTLMIDSLLSLSCLSAQTVRIAQHPAVDHGKRTELTERTITLCRKVIGLSLPGRLMPLRSFLEDNRQHSKREAGIQDDQAAVKCIVTVNHILQTIATQVKLSNLLFDRLGNAVTVARNVQVLDQLWYDIFTLQPLLEIDARGILRPGSRYQSSNDGWEFVRNLLQRLFELVSASANIQNPTLNEYIRACFSRAFYLITRWGWHRCEPVLNVIYDFFAGSGFAQLHNEESRGSPRFLEDLDKSPTIQLEPGDTAFHVFLKILVVGLQGLQLVYPKHKIRGFAWRFIPNHGRTYRKDQEITQVDLDALRNNHDLLCTLYWVLPRGYGPRLQMLADLVDHTTSHREACRLAVHAWAMIAKYQLGKTEKFDDLGSLATWYADMTSITTSQYRMARAEAETQYAAEVAKGDTDITLEVVDATIASNQRGILATILDLLRALHNAVRVAASWNVSRSLVELSNLTDVFKLFDTDQPRLFAAILEALDIVQSLLRTKPQPQIVESQQGSDDSQEYGDWSYLEEAADDDTVTNTPSKSTELSFLHEPLAMLLSSSFGADKSPDDDLLRKLVDVWTAVASEQVQQKVHDWSNYLDAYSSLSWFQLRDTSQLRKYTPYFAAALIKVDVSAVQEHRIVFLRIWLACLLERESALKFQHLLTNALLNTLTDEPLLRNLPFASNRLTGEFDITLREIRERRASLIDCILSNMRVAFSDAASSPQSSFRALRTEYEDMLKQLMTAMKRNYEELQQMTAGAGDGNIVIKGAYVSLVQHVVSLMQQYTFDICKIDKFFVDSSAFPLPSNDPTYVVGRLRRYAFKLGEPRARKELAVFMQTVTERAAIDNEQVYLVGQLRESMTGEVSDSLRNFMMTTIFPIYLEAAQATTCGWILALPLLDATARIIEELIYHFDIRHNVQVNIATVTAALHSICQWVLSISQDISRLAQPHNLRVLNASFKAAQAALTIVDYANRRLGEGQEAVKVIYTFVRVGRFLSQKMRGGNDITFPNIDQVPIESSRHTETANFGRKALLEDLEKYWVQRGDDGYFVVRGNNARNIKIVLGSPEEERDSTLKSLGAFLEDYGLTLSRKNRIATVAFEDVYI